jgi:hypothetical protein
MPIPFGLKPDQFAKRFRGLLDKHSNALLAELRKVVATTVGNGVTAATVEIFLDEYGERGPGVGMYFDGEGKKVDHTDPSIFAGRHLPLAEYLRELPSFDRRYFSAEDFRALDLQADVTKAWLAEWWWKAGGWDYPLPVEVAVHDDFGNGERILLSTGS